jgi:hypothetical protein
VLSRSGIGPSGNRYGLRNDVSGTMSGLTSGWIGDPRVVDRPGPHRFHLIDLGQTACLGLRIWD